MRSACLTMAALLLALLPFAAKGDRLDTLVTQLDRLEPAFWKALAMKSDSDYRRDVEKQLSETVATAREVQKVASRYGSRHPNITTELNKIRTIFQEVEPFSAQNYRFGFKYTSLRDYEQQFRKDQPEMRKKREKPTMANVRIADYERWLDEVMRDNVNRVRRQRGGSSGSGSGGGEKSDEAMKARTVTFFHAVATIRLTLMKYRQEGRPDFPE
ncbi:MAG: hypothetical protein HP002_03920 [Lentisphaeria bacterium]|uniref:hypothetical protein n=2 Tax=Victivallis lenta TaxID=2606640 RepID=UPI000D025D57|nr:hypothetical protein [Victivallis lenta]AVM44291.1 hypothetical protein C5Q97_06010 [Victivallales bacterium CCUG 44730]MBS1452512.1 hypothetical protein [Lentisphaeria bacterium]MBS5529257.1 hypothetical protein [bacterium]